MTALPAYTVRVAKLPGAPYSTTTIKVAGVVIRSVLGPLSETQVEEYVRAYLAPAVGSRTDDMAAFMKVDKRSAKGGRKKAPRVTDRGFMWKEPEE